MEEGQFSWKKAFFKWSGLFLVVMAAIAVYFIIDNAQAIFSAGGMFVGILRPVVYGCVIAYILNPLMKVFEDILVSLLKKSGKSVTQKKKGIITGISITLSLIFGIVIIIVLCWMVIPQLLISISSLAESLPGQINYYYRKLNESIRNNAFLADRMQDMALNATEYLDEMVNKELFPWIQSELLPNVNKMAVEFANGVITLFNVLYNLFIGIIVAIYVLASKATFSAQAKKLAYGIFKKKYADVAIQYVKISNEMFSGFIIGKIVDSSIIGVICFVAMTVLRLPYAMLISVIVGVTNIIPVFGPYIGAIPSVLLILIVSPVQALYFLVMVIILQQLDGNIIGPAILGESTGLSAFWVLFSILLFGGLWGIVGMIVGVPLFAVIYRIISDFINWKLAGHGLSTATEYYRNLKCIEINDQNEPAYIPYAEDEFRKKRGEKKEKKKGLSLKIPHLKMPEKNKKRKK